MAKSNRQQRHRQVEFMVEISALHFSHENVSLNRSGVREGHKTSSANQVWPTKLICLYCVSIFTCQIKKQKEKQKEKRRQIEFTAEMDAAFVETKAQKRATADKHILEKYRQTATYR